MRQVERLAQNFVLEGFLAEQPLQFADLVLQSSVFGGGHHFLAGRDCQEFRARLSGLTDQSMAAVKRSPKRTANCDLAMDHSRGGMIHSFSERFKTRNRSLVAASSLGKWPLALTARRSLELSASMAFVTGMKIAV